MGQIVYLDVTVIRYVSCFLSIKIQPYTLNIAFKILFKIFDKSIFFTVFSSCVVLSLYETELSCVDSCVLHQCSPVFLHKKYAQGLHHLYFALRW